MLIGEYNVAIGLFYLVNYADYFVKCCYNWYKSWL